MFFFISLCLLSYGCNIPGGDLADKLLPKPYKMTEVNINDSVKKTRNIKSMEKSDSEMILEEDIPKYIPSITQKIAQSPSILETPMLVGSYDTPGASINVKIVGNLAYVADQLSGLQIIDISNPSSPVLKGSYDTPGFALDVEVVGNLAYVADWNLGLQVIDISNPSSPVLKGSYDTPGLALSVKVIGDLAYIADNYSGLQIIDISNPSLPVFKKKYSTFGRAWGVEVIGNLAYIADEGSGLQIVYNGMVLK